MSISPNQRGTLSSNFGSSLILTRSWGKIKFYDLETLPDFVDCILILSGSENPFLTKEHNQVNLNESSERLIESMKLINKYPQAKIVFSGCYKIKDDDICSSEVVMKLFIQNNISINNIIFENQSRNTYENLLFSKRLVKPTKYEKWILITSAFHLRRSMGIAEQLQWSMIPYPTDFQTAKKIKWELSFNLIKNFYILERSSHEWLGLFTYYLLGRTSSIL